MTETTAADAATEGATANGVADAAKGKRGKGFPTMDLVSAVETIATVGGNGAEVPVAAFAQYLGHSTATSGPFKTKLAAFRDWGLVTTKDGRVLLTPLAKELAKAEDPKADVALLRRAFDFCKIFKDFYENQAKGVPIRRDVLGKRATIDLAVSATSQDKFVSTLVDSATAVGLATYDTEAGTVTFGGTAVPEPDELGATAADSGSETTPAGTGTPTPPKPPTPPTPAPASGSAAPVLLRQVWPTATGEVVLAVHSTEPLPASAFAIVAQVVQAATDLAESIRKADGDYAS